MAAIGTAWVDGSWVETGWVTGAWSGLAAPEIPTIQRAKVNRADLKLWDGNVKTTKRLDATGGFITELTIDEDVDVLQVFGLGTKRTSATLNKAIDRVSSACFLIGTGHWLVTEDVTIPATISCRIAAGCTFTVTSGKILTFNGPVYVEHPTWWAGDDGAVLTNLGARGFPGY